MLPMLAKRIDELPAGQTWIFEPKWDGFRALIFRDRDEILIQSRDAKSLNRYFPELLEDPAAVGVADVIEECRFELDHVAVGVDYRMAHTPRESPPNGSGLNRS